MLWFFVFFNRYKNELSSFLDHLLKCISQACKLMMPDPHFKLSKDKGKIVSMSNRKSEVGG